MLVQHIGITMLGMNLKGLFLQVVIKTENECFQLDWIYIKTIKLNILSPNKPNALSVQSLKSK